MYYFRNDSYVLYKRESYFNIISLCFDKKKILRIQKENIIKCNMLLSQLQVNMGAFVFSILTLKKVVGTTS